MHNLFPALNDYQLTALAWSGLTGTTAFNNQYPAWKDAQNGWINDYLNGTVGTKGCN